MHLISKYASPLALLCALSGLVAAPYLIPENPDSAVFRSGLFGTLLLLACFFPLRDALRRANRRTLVCALGFGLLLGTALSLGAELRFYSGLLPGMGSMIRRLAVPVLCAPLLGGLAARCMLAGASPADSRRAGRIPMWGYMVILLVCWLPLFITYYPGMLNYDISTEYRQFYYGEWDDRHPLLYCVITYAFYHLGRIIDQPTLAMAMVTALRMVTFAAALAYSCVFAQRRGAPRPVLMLMTALYAFLPIFSVMSVSAAKDTPFSAALLVLSLQTWEAIEDPEAFFTSKRRMILYALMVLFVYHLRKNGVAALVLLPVLILSVRGWRKKAVLLCAVSLGATLLLNTVIYAICQPFAQPSFQLYSLPAQQLVRAYMVGDMTEEEKAELVSWYVEPGWALILYPHLADAAKGYLNQDMLRENADEFMDLWARVGQKNKRIYAEAFLMLNIGSWYPDDLTHTRIYRDTVGMVMGYLQVDEFNFEEYGVHYADPLPKLRHFVNRMMRLNEYQKYPVITVLLCTATPLWVLLFACAQLIAKRQSRFVPVASGVLVLWVSYLFGPCTLARYVLPLFCLCIPMLIMSMTLPERAKAE